MPFGRGVRDLWLRLGDLEGLLRRSTPFHVPASLMRGDEVFYKELRGALGRLVDEAPPDRRPPASLRLILTATRLRPRRDLVRPTLGRPLPVGRSHAYFRFRHRGALTDFPDDVTGAARETALDRLAYAARTSSSFPGAFEPGRVYVGNGAQPVEDPPRVDMRGVSSESGHPDEDLNGCAELMDGGLLDNIPVAWAVRAVAGAPVARKADRRLLFLQPVPPFPPPPEPGGSRRVTRLVRMAAKSLAVKTGSESLRDDALELRAAEAAAEQQRAVLGVLPLTLTELYDAAMARLDPYARTAGRAEAQRLIRLLADPAEVTGPDALPLPAGPGPLEALDESAAEGSAALFARLRRAADGLAVEPGTLPGPGYSPLALARTVRLLMDWLRAYESGAGPVEAELVEAYRTRLFACRSAVATLNAARDRLLLGRYRAALSLGLMPTDATAPYGEATCLLGALMPPVPPPEAAPAHWETWAANLAAAVGAGSPPEVPATGPAEVPEGFGHLWERLADLGQEIGLDLSPDVDGYEALHAAARGAGPPMAEALAYAEVLLGPLRPDPLAEATDIDFHTVSAADTSWATRTVLPQVAPDSPEDMVRAKLSGNQLNNFAAFLSARRRMSDWTWGRLDGAAALVSVVATDERLHDAFGDPADLTALGEEIAGGDGTRPAVHGALGAGRHHPAGRGPLGPGAGRAHRGPPARDPPRGTATPRRAAPQGLPGRQPAPGLPAEPAGPAHTGRVRRGPGVLPRDRRRGGRPAAPGAGSAPGGPAHRAPRLAGAPAHGQSRGPPGTGPPRRAEAAGLPPGAGRGRGTRTGPVRGRADVDGHRLLHRRLVLAPRPRPGLPVRHGRPGGTRPAADPARPAARPGPPGRDGGTTRRPVAAARPAHAGRR